jgi:MazG family protein
MAREEGLFTVEDVVRGINEKLVRRHPHVFGDTEVKDSAEVLRNWARIKTDERKHREDNSVVTGVPRAMPALLRAHRLGEKASGVGFDWDSASAVLEKVREELSELQSAVDLGEPSAVEAELGDLLFALSSLGRHFDLQAEDALQRASDRFIRRFRYMERRLTDRQQDVHATSPADLNNLWEEAQRDERRQRD